MDVNHTPIETESTEAVAGSDTEAQAEHAATKQCPGIPGAATSAAGAAEDNKEYLMSLGEKYRQFGASDPLVLQMGCIECLVEGMKCPYCDSP